MIHRLRLAAAVAAGCLALTCPLAAAGDDDSAASYVRYPDDAVTTRHSVTIAGERVDYIATAGTIAMVKGESADDHSASMFFIAYRKVTGVKSGLEMLCELELDEDQKKRLGVRLSGSGSATDARVSALLDDS